MFEDIVLVHRPAGAPAKKSSPFMGVDDSSWVLWKTCLRHIAIGTAASRVSPLFVPATDEIYRGAAAYQFFLEVISGLHSPIIGETEVMGQIKELNGVLGDLVRQGRANAVQNLVYKFISFAVTDTKVVREKCLRNLGNRSYGSLLRRYISEADSLHLVGAGKLIKEILPWLINKTPQTYVYCRRSAQGEELKEAFPGIKIKGWKASGHVTEVADGVHGQAWIIAAPIEAKEINHFFKNQKTIKAIVDLRDDSDTDPIQIKNFEILKLKEFFNQIEGAQLEVKARAVEAKEFIAGLVIKRLQTVEIRPFGWEDLCG